MRNRSERLQPGRRSLWWIVLLLLLLLLWLLLAYLRGVWPFSPAAVYPPEAFFMQDQVVVTGSQAEVDAAMAALPAGMAQLQERLVVDEMLGGQPCPGLPAGGRVIDLYQMGNSDDSVGGVIEAIENAAGSSGDVTAEPNWLAGAPWEIEGSPWEIEGSPWEIEGSGGGGAPPAALGADYQEQWAWQPQAINLQGSQLPVTGARVRVGIFDTSPFDEPAAGAPAAVQPVNWVGQPTPLSLLVRHPEPAATLSPEGEESSPDLSNHGLFVAGLVYAVAPGSNIELIRVLGADNRGDLFTLNREMARFISETSQRDSMGTVLNLSLGLRIPPEEAEFGLPDQVQSLRDILAVARCRQMVVVAAAGNHSAGMDSPEPPTLPAAWSSVIGVAASNQANGRACFSNQGDVAAPGGDGSSPAECAPQLAGCQGPNCPYALVGPVLMPPAETGYTYWTGSSFAAPLVSGLAALVLEMGQGQMTAADVQAIIECGARPGDRTLGSGVINVGRTLEQCMGLARAGD